MYKLSFIFQGHTVEPWYKLGINIAGAASIASWTAAWSFLIFYPFQRFGYLRVTPLTEFKGLDQTEHGETAYPVDAWVETQYNNPEGQRRPSIPSLMQGSPGWEYNPSNLQNMVTKLQSCTGFAQSRLRKSNFCYGSVASDGLFLVSPLLQDCSLCWDRWNGTWCLHLTRPCLLALGQVLIWVKCRIGCGALSIGLIWLFLQGSLATAEL